MTTTTPANPIEQRLAALQCANETRTARALIKHAIHAGDVGLALILIRNPTPIVASMRTAELVSAIHGYGGSRGYRGRRRCARLERLLKRSGVTPTRTLASLTQRQRDELCRRIEEP